MAHMTHRRSARTAALCLSAALISPAIAGGDECLGANPFSDEGILELAPGVDFESLQARYATQPDPIVFTLLDSIPGRGIYLVAFGDQISENEFELLFLNDPEIDHSELNFEAGDPGPGTQSIFLFTAPGMFLDQPVVTSLGLEDAQGQATGAGVTIAVIDSGIDTTHGQFTGRIAPGAIAFTAHPVDAEYDPNAYQDTCDLSDIDQDTLLSEAVGHGTAVASLSLLVAPDARVLPIKVLDDEGYTTAFRVAKAIYYAIDQRVGVINLSLSSCADLRIIERAVDEAEELGIIIVAAAGNSGASADGRPEFPGAMNKVAGVVATDTIGQVAGFSNYGDSYFVAAPGIDIIGAIPDANCGAALPGSEFGEADGTSFAAPLVAGLAALLIEQEKVLRWNDFRDAMRATAINIEGLNPGLDEPVEEGLIDVAAAIAWPGPCHADFTDDLTLDFSDVSAFLAAFAIGDDEADMAQPRGVHDFSDVVKFLQFFTAGCP